MTERDHQACEHLHTALKDARSRLSPPLRDTSAPGFQRTITLDPGDTTPDGDPALHAEIRQLEQALRDAGCEPD